MPTQDKYDGKSAKCMRKKCQDFSFLKSGIQGPWVHVIIPITVKYQFQRGQRKFFKTADVERECETATESDWKKYAY